MIKINPSILSKTVKVITPKTEKVEEAQIRGTIVFRNNEQFVQLDGAPDSALTPISDVAEGASDAGFVNGDRVLVLLKNHQAIVTKNLTVGLQAQAAKDAGAFVTTITDEGITAQRIIANDTFTNTLRANHIKADDIVAGMATIETLDTNYAHITEGVIDNATIGVADVNDLEANYAHITRGVIDNATIDQADVNNLDANYAHITQGVIDNATIDQADVNDLDANYAHISNGVIDNAKIGVADVNDLSANYAHITQGVIDNATIDQANINNLAANYAKVNAANIDSAAIGNAWVDKIMVQTGLLAYSSQIYTLDAIEVNAANITAGTLDVNRLIVTVGEGSSAQKYLVNIDPSTGTPSYEKLDGNIVAPRTITADKIVANSITTNEITANNLVGTSGWINLHEGKFFYGDGASFASATNAISWNGSKLQIKADEFLLSTGQTIQDSIESVENWFYSVPPTTSNPPASSWTTTNLKEQHLRDIYFDTTSGKSYRWAKEGSTYKWVEIEDVELSALAKDLHDNYPPYSEFTVQPDQIAIEVGKKVGTNEVIAKINASTEGVQIQATKVDIAGAAVFNNYSTTQQMNEAIGTAVDAVDTKVDGANLQEQRIYYRSNSTSVPTAPSTWVTSTSTANATWSTKRMQYDSTYKYLYTCIQRKTVGGTITNSTVLLDDTTTVIDGGNIITGTVAANAVNASSGTFNTANIPNLNASKITAGDISTDRMKLNSISAINGNTGTVKISASKVEIDGTATFNAIKSSTDAAYDAKGAASTAQTNAINAVWNATNGFTILWNYENFTAANNGEGYICKLDPKTGTKSDANGTVMWNGTSRTITKQMINPNTIAPYNIPIYVVCRLSSATATTGTNYIVWYNSGWKYAALPTPSAVGGDWTWVEATDIILGKFVEPSSEAAFTDCEIYDPPLSSKQITTDIVTARSAQSLASTANTTAGNANTKADQALKQSVWYATCSTDAATVAKVATITPTTTAFTLTAGASVNVKFSTTNSGAVGSITLNVNNTGAKNIKYIYNNTISNIPGVGYILGGATYQFVYDGTYWVIQNLNYNSNNIDRVLHNNYVKAASAVTSGAMACGTSAGYKQIAASVTFDLAYPILWAGGAWTSGTQYANAYEAYPSVNPATTGTVQSVAVNLAVYLKGTVSGNTFTIAASNFLTCAIPTSEDGFFYIPLGVVANDATTKMYFSSSRDLYAYIDGKFRQVTPTEIVASQRIYYRSSVNTKPTAMPTAWVTETGNKYNANATTATGWSTKVTPIASGTGASVTKYLYLWTCEQRKRLDGSLAYTNVLLDDSTTVIDGGTIVTGTVNANAVKASSGTFDTANIPNLSAAKITSGTLDAARIGANSIAIGKLATAVQANMVEYIVGTQTASTNVWTGVTRDASLTTGKTIAYYLPYNGTSTAATLNLTLSGGGTTGAKNVRLNNSNVTTHYPAGSVITLTYDGTYWKTPNYNSDTYNRIRYQAVLTAAAAITNGRIICGTASGYRNIAASVAFDLTYPLLYAGTAIAAGATDGTRDNNYLTINGITYSSNGTITSGAANKTIYLKGTISSGKTFTIAASPFLTTVPPTTADGYAYIPLGVMTSATVGYFSSSQDIWAYQNGKFHKVDAVSDYITQVDANGIWVTPTGKKPTNTSTGAGATGTRINADGMQIYKAGVQVANYGDTATVGSTAAGKGNVLTRNTSGSAGIDLRIGTTTVASLYQKPNYTPPEDATVYNNAFVISAIQYLAMLANGKVAFESNGADSAAIRLANSDFLYTDNFDEANGGGRVDVELWGPIVEDDGSTDYTTFINVFAGPEYDGDGTMSGVGIGVSEDDIEIHGVWDYLKDRWLIGTSGGSNASNAGKICCPGINLNTTSGGANVRSLGANVSNYPDYGIAKYASSSRRYKEDIDDLTDIDLDANRLYDLRVAQFRYKEDYLEYGDSRYHKLVPGLIAEEVEEVYPIAVQYENEMVEDWEPKFIIPPMLKLIQDQKKKIDELEERLEALERK